MNASWKTMLAILWVLLPACQDPGVYSQTDSLIMNPNQAGLFPNPKKIPVCFTAGPKNMKDLFRSYISKDFGRAGFGFQFKDQCDSNDFNQKTIRVQLNVQQGVSYGASGVSLVGASRGSMRGCGNCSLVVNSGSLQNSSPQIRDMIKGVMAHEMGHALGLFHEHDRDDATKKQGACSKENTVLGRMPRGAVKVGEYDRNSLMNYCKNQNAIRLTAGDIKGLHTLYPALKNQKAQAQNTPAKAGASVPKEKHTFEIINETDDVLEVREGRGTNTLKVESIPLGKSRVYTSPLGTWIQVRAPLRGVVVEEFQVTKTTYQVPIEPF